jgi:hypothetical protein
MRMAGFVEAHAAWGISGERVDGVDGNGRPEEVSATSSG